VKDKDRFTPARLKRNDLEAQYKAAAEWMEKGRNNPEAIKDLLTHLVNREGPLDYAHCHVALYLIALHPDLKSESPATEFLAFFENNHDSRTHVELAFLTLHKEELSTGLQRKLESILMPKEDKETIEQSDAYLLFLKAIWNVSSIQDIEKQIKQSNRGNCNIFFQRQRTLYSLAERNPHVFGSFMKSIADTHLLVDERVRHAGEGGGFGLSYAMESNEKVQTQALHWMSGLNESEFKSFCPSGSAFAAALGKLKRDEKEKLLGVVWPKHKPHLTQTDGYFSLLQNLPPTYLAECVEDILQLDTDAFCTLMYQEMNNFFLMLSVSESQKERMLDKALTVDDLSRIFKLDEKFSMMRMITTGGHVSELAAILSSANDPLKNKILDKLFSFDDSVFLSMEALTFWGMVLSTPKQRRHQFVAIMLKEEEANKQFFERILRSTMLDCHMSTNLNAFAHPEKIKLIDAILKPYPFDAKNSYKKLDSIKKEANAILQITAKTTPDHFILHLRIFRLLTNLYPHDPQMIESVLIKHFLSFRGFILQTLIPMMADMPKHEIANMMETLYKLPWDLFAHLLMMANSIEKATEIYEQTHCGFLYHDLIKAFGVSQKLLTALPEPFKNDFNNKCDDIIQKLKAHKKSELRLGMMAAPVLFRGLRQDETSVRPYPIKEEALLRFRGSKAKLN